MQLRVVFLLKRYSVTDEGNQKITQLVKPYEHFAHKDIAAFKR
ncbi:TPA: hypothetical protein ACN337_003377 [Vibrio parahaemolyticus]|nr:hypothetical protein [Vibrio parahaemolyticus]